MTDTTATAAKSNLDLIRATYENAPEENARHLRAILAPSATWTEAAGFPYAGTYTGAEEIFENVFKRLGSEWVGYKAVVHTYMADDDRVSAFGVYSGTYGKTGKSMSATFAHLYRLVDGKIVTMEQFVDSATVQEALKA